MNEFKRVIGRLKQHQERETVEQARDKAVEAAAKFRQVAELALCALLPTLDVSHCDPADLESIHRFMEETSHLNAMTDAEPLTLIRLLLESTDSPELPYINAANQASAFLEQLQIEQLRLLAVTEILKRKGSVGSRFRIEQLKAINSLMGWILDGVPEQSFSDFLQKSYCIPQAAIDQQILRQMELTQGKEPANDDAKNKTSEMSGLQGSGAGRGDVKNDVPVSEMPREL